MVLQKLKSALFAGAAVAMTIALGSTPAAALPIQPLFTLGDNHLSDNSAEWLIKGTEAGAIAGVVQVGDQLVGVGGYNTVEPNGASIGKLTPYSELTAYFDLLVTGIAGPCGSPFCFQFGPTGTFAPTGFAANPNLMVAFYQDPSDDYTRLGVSRATMIADATDGTAFMDAGVTAGDNFWNAGTLTNNIVSGGSAPPGTPFGSFEFGLGIVQNLSGLSFGLRTCFNTQTGLPTTDTSICGQGGLLAKDTTSQADSFDNVDTFVNVVPEPGTLSLFGLGLLGLGFAGMRRRKAS